MSYYDDIPRDALEATFDYEDDRPTLADCDFELDDDDRKGYCHECGTDLMWDDDADAWFCPNCYEEEE